MSIVVNGISKLYGEQKALDNVSFTIRNGEIVGFLGPNGAGKSTMMKILTCYIPQSKGSAEICGMNTEEQSINIRKKVGYLPEHNPLYLEMYVKEYLGFIAGIHKSSRDRIPEMIEKTGLTPEKHKKIGQLSKGYRQRAGLAAAMLHDPEVLILDEPTTGLDPNQLVEIRNLIKEIGKEKTVMLSTHIMQEVEVLCDRVIIINKGKIVADRPTADLKNFQGSKTFVVEFDKKITPKALQNIEGVKQTEDLQNNKWRLTSNDGIDIRTHLFQFAIEQELTVLEVKQEEQRLEDVFQKLTRS